MIGFWLRIECISLGKNVVAWRLADLIKMTLTRGRGDMPISHCKDRYYRQQQACQGQKHNRKTPCDFQEKMAEKEIGYGTSSLDCQYASESRKQSKLRLFSNTKKSKEKSKLSPRLRSQKSTTETHSPSDSDLSFPPIG